MARARQKKKVLMRRLAKRRTRYETTPTLDGSVDEIHGESRESDESRGWQEVADALLIEA